MRVFTLRAILKFRAVSMRLPQPKRRPTTAVLVNMQVSLPVPQGSLGRFGKGLCQLPHLKSFSPLPVSTWAGSHTTMPHMWPTKGTHSDNPADFF